ncbi:MAG: penicillin-binding protein activator LpoB [Magnetococcales bacterium]|nr:penicillin-binding protein activator LpoB [Magnetococcales bacterium]
MCARLTVLVVSFWLILGTLPAWSASKAVRESGPPRIAVTDLTYEDKVQEYFRNVDMRQQDARPGRGRYGERESSVSYQSQEGTRIIIDRGELHKFTSDIKGELIKAGYPLVQGRPFAMKDQERIFDIIARIKKGDYSGADYVLFGTVSSLEFRNETTPVSGSQTVSHALNLELVVDFSLINTKTFAVSAAFNAMGVGSDVRLQESAAARVSLSQGRVMAEASKNIAQEVIRQLSEQIRLPGGDPVGAGRSGMPRQSYPNYGEPPEEVIIYK